MWRMDLEHAIRTLEPGLALCRASGNRAWLQPLAGNLGSAYALQGRLAAGRALLEETISESISTGTRLGHALWVRWLSEAYLLAGRLEDAHTRAAQAVDLARQYQQRGNQAWALWLLGESTARQASPAVEPAVGHYRQALALAEELGMRPLQAHCHRGLGTLYAATGQLEQARDALDAAIALYRAMDMTLWLPQAEATLAQIGGRSQRQA